MRIAVAGLAFGAQVHVPGWKSVPGCEVVAVCGQRADKTRETALRLNVARHTTDFQELLAIRPDILSIALPPVEGEKLAKMALKAGIPVLMEKPLASSAHKAQELLNLSVERRIPTAVDFQFLDLPAFQKLFMLLRVGIIGKIESVKVDWQLESYTMKNKLWSWKTDVTREGGVLGVLGSHFLFLLEQLLNHQYKIVDARCSNEKTLAFAPSPELAAEDQIELEFQDTIAPTVHALICNSNPEGKGHRWHFEGELGSITLHNPTQDYMSGFYVDVAMKDQPVERIYEDKAVPGVDGRLTPFISLATRFSTHVLEAKKRGTAQPFCPSFEDGARVQAWIEKIRAQF